MYAGDMKTCVRPLVAGYISIMSQLLHAMDDSFELKAI